MVSIAVVASIIILTITFIKKQLSILIKQKKQMKNKVYKLIKNWYIYVERYKKEVNQDMLNQLESEVDLFFQQARNKNLTLKFNRKFRRTFLKEMGLKKEYYENTEIFLRNAGLLNDDGIVLSLQLYGKAKNIRTSDLLKKPPFKYYWNIMRANFCLYYKQLLKDREDVTDKKKQFWQNIEMLFRILRRRFND